MICSIMQPAYLPWLGYFHRIALSDVHVVLDHVQIDKSSRTKFANRNRVRTADGWCWLTVPLSLSGTHGRAYLNELEIASDDKWRKRHEQTLRQCYARTAFFGDHEGFLREIYDRPWRRLTELTRELTPYLMNAFKIDTPVLFSSDIAPSSSKDELLVELCQEVGGDAYLSGPFGRDYIRPAVFASAGIELLWHEFKHPVYQQAFPGFEPNMAAIDLLANCGPESRAILMEDQEALV